MKFLLVTLALVLISGCLAVDENDFNKIIDSIIAKKKADPGELDPLKIADKGVEFERKLGFFTVKGIAKFRNISMQGLSKLSREGDVKTEKLSDEKHRMTLKIKINNINATMEGVIGIQNLGSSRRYSALIEHLEGEAQLTWDKSSDKIELSKFKVTQQTGVQLKIVGSFEFVDALTNYVIRVAAKSFDRSLRYVNEFTLTKLFQDQVAKSETLKKAMAAIQ